MRANNDKRLIWVFRKQPNPIRYCEAIQTLERSPEAQVIVSDITSFLGEKKELKISKKEFKFKPLFKLTERFHPSIVLGKILETLCEFEKAIDYYRNVLLLSTGSNYWMVEILDLHRSWAVCYYEIGDYKKALAILSVGVTLLQVYKKRVEKKDGGIVPIEKKLIMEEELLYGEEFMLTYKMRLPT